MRILLTNDDGVNSDGILALEKALSKIGEVWTVAPVEEKSAQSHAFTMREPLTFTRLKMKIFTRLVL